MNGNEFIRKLRKLGKAIGVDVRYNPKPGKGSHGKLFFGERSTTLKDPKTEIGPGLLNNMLKSLGLTKGDIS